MLNCRAIRALRKTWRSEILLQSEMEEQRADTEMTERGEDGRGRSEAEKKNPEEKTGTEMHHGLGGWHTRVMTCCPAEL